MLATYLLCALIWAALSWPVARLIGALFRRQSRRVEHIDDSYRELRELRLLEQSRRHRDISPSERAYLSANFD